MSQSFFAKEISTENILTADELAAIFTHFHMPEHPIPFKRPPRNMVKFSKSPNAHDIDSKAVGYATVFSGKWESGYTQGFFVGLQLILRTFIQCNIRQYTHTQEIPSRKIEHAGH